MLDACYTMSDYTDDMMERDSLAQLASVETGEVLRHSEPTSEHAGDKDFSDSGCRMI